MAKPVAAAATGVLAALRRKLRKRSEKERKHVTHGSRTPGDFNNTL
jgi:hypothetical protein